MPRPNCLWKQEHFKNVFAMTKYMIKIIVIIDITIWNYKIKTAMTTF